MIVKFSAVSLSEQLVHSVLWVIISFLCKVFASFSKVHNVHIKSELYFSNFRENLNVFEGIPLFCM